MEAVKELFGLLGNNSVRTDVRETALVYILGLTVVEEGLQLITSKKEYLDIIIQLISQEDISFTKLAHKCLLSITSFVDGANALLSMRKDFFMALLNEISCSQTSFIEMKCIILSNATSHNAVYSYIAEDLTENIETVCNAVNSFNCNASATSQDYDTLALFLGNIFQNEKVRRKFLTNGCDVLKSLTSYTTYPHSEIRRHGIAILLKNLAFEIEHHSKILEELDVLPSLLLPLIGSEELDEDEMEKLPIACQYLGSEKEREHNSEIRIVLLEALLKLCATRYGRNYLRDNGAYYVLRELHKWETESTAIKACEDVVEILIRDEPDVDTDNLMNLQIPEDLQKQFDDLSVTPTAPDVK